MLLLDGPPPEGMFTGLLQLCVFVPVVTVFVSLLVMNGWRRRGILVACAVAAAGAVLILLPAYRLFRFGYPFAPSLGFFAAPWVAAIVPFAVIIWSCRVNSVSQQVFRTGDSGKANTEFARVGICIVVSAVLAARSAESVWDFANMVPFVEWNEKPRIPSWLFLDTVGLLFLSDLIRQIVLRRLFRVRLTVEIVLVAATWVDRYTPFYPGFAVFTLALGCLVAMVIGLINDIRQLPEPSGAKTNRSIAER
jgi:hypothetical protein